MSSYLPENERLLDAPGINPMGDYETGVQWPFVVVIIIAEMMGGGLANLPASVEHARRALGFTYIVLAGLLSLYTSFLLNWLYIGMHKLLRGDNTSVKMKSAQWPANKSLSLDEVKMLRRMFRDDVYAAIAWTAVRCRGWGCSLIPNETLATAAAHIVRFLTCVTLMGVAIVFTVVTSIDMVELTHRLNLLQWMAIVTTLVLLLSPFFGHVKDYRYIGTVSALMTVGIVLTIIIGMSMSYENEGHPDVEHEPFAGKDAIRAYGNILFMFGGHAGFPAYQSSMKKPRYFMRAVLIAYTFILTCMIAIALMGSFMFGNNLQANLPDTFEGVKRVVTAMTVFFVGHMVTAMGSVISPVAGTFRYVLSMYAFCVHRDKLKNGEKEGSSSEGSSSLDTASTQSRATPPSVQTQRGSVTSADMTMVDEQYSYAQAPTATSSSLSPSMLASSFSSPRNGNTAETTETTTDQLQRTRHQVQQRTQQSTRHNQQEDEKDLQDSFMTRFRSLALVLGIVFGVAFSARQHFPVAMSYIGAIPISAVTFVIPCLLYITFYVNNRSHDEYRNHWTVHSNILHIILCSITVICSLLGSLSALVFDIKDES
jgi:hypothetical protein